MLNPLLYGHDSEEGIVGLHRMGPNIRVYIRDGQHLRYEDRQLHEYLLLTDDGWRKLEKAYSRQGVKYSRLNGKAHYNHLVVVPSSWEARVVLEGTDDREVFKSKDYYHVGGKPIQYLMSTGKTLFKGMQFADLHRLQFDLEVISPEGNFPKAENPQDEIVIISISDNRGYEAVYHTHPEVTARKTKSGALLVKYDTEAEMIAGFVDLIQLLDPDVIENHNIFRFDLPYLRERAKMHDVYLGLGRDKRSPFWYERTTKFAEKDIEFENCLIAGRHVIDTMFLAMGWDVFARKLESYGLKSVAKQFGFASDDRTYIEGRDITNHWFNDPMPLLEYAMDDVREVRMLSDMLSGASFYLTQMVPMDFQRVALSGTGAVIESLFVRQYIHAREALPKYEIGRQEGGGFTGTKRTGVFHHAIYADVESLYPSIMLRYGIQPERDTLQIFPKLLQDITDMRFEAKNARANFPKDSQPWNELEARQQAYKIVINSFYGYLSWAFGLFNDYSEGERVARVGRGILQSMMDRIEELGLKVILFDTDGVLFSTGERLDEADQYKLIAKIQEAMPKGINIGHDGEFKDVFAYKPKNYVLRGYDNKLTIKGNSLKSRGYEKFLVDFQEKMFMLLMDRDYTGINKLYNDVREKLIRREYGIRDLEKSSTLHKSRTEYLNARHLGETPISGAYELAYEQEKLSFEPKEGDIVRYYVGPKHLKSQPLYQVVKVSDEYDNDEDTQHYLNRLDTVIEKYKPLFTEEDFGTLFAKKETLQGSLFPDDHISQENVTILTT